MNTLIEKMAENSKIVNIINEFLDHKDIYEVGKKVTVIEPMDEYWRELVCLFLAAVVYYLKETHTSKDELCYYAVLDFINKAWRMNIEELTALFLDKGRKSEAYKCYSALLDMAGTTVLSVLIAAHTKIKGIYYDKQRIAEFERVFEV